MPQYQEVIRTIRMRLDENERGNTTRLMKVKDMMIEAQIARPDDDEDGEEPVAEPGTTASEFAENL